ncbi:protein phosphatase 1B [Scaptodrosophila lebanonensis]|uniref:Protein phosphatase 1B n=1 Tax=Drosophila lebanonensis TaxID=7225 RepID=A0A6J2U0X8_DROLE|nr:protein phosphatase 1B [Scaptodrosophila lebanonensis]
MSCVLPSTRPKRLSPQTARYGVPQPNVDQQMGGFLDKPITEKHVNIGCGNGIRYCVSSMQGWRLEMEDSHTTNCRLPKPYEDWSFFAVYDGHAGHRVASHCSTKMLDAILSTEAFTKGQYAAGIRAAFLKIDEDMRLLPLEKPGGSTAVCVFVTPQQYIFANCGDSRAVLSRRGLAVFSTRDHKPTLPLERARIQKAGGSVIIHRVNGTLAVSRALGDFDFKSDALRTPCDQLVSPEPDVTTRERIEKDEFLVVACDGIWDVMTSDEVCAFIHWRMRVTDNLPLIVNSILDVCLYKGSRDNMSLLLVILPGAPGVCADAVLQDRLLDEAVAEKTRQVIHDNNIVDFDDLLRAMNGVDIIISNLPPGGGIYAKYHIIERVFREMFPNKTADFFEFSHITGL